jgi:hypothetical protein
VQRDGLGRIISSDGRVLEDANGGNVGVQVDGLGRLITSDGRILDSEDPPRSDRDRNSNSRTQSRSQSRSQSRFEEQDEDNHGWAPRDGERPMTLLPEDLGLPGGFTDKQVISIGLVPLTAESFWLIIIRNVSLHMSRTSWKQGWKEEALLKARQAREEEAANGIGANAIPLGKYCWS